MWEAVLILSILVPYVQASWQAVYNANYSLAFVQSKNGSVYKYQIDDKIKTIASGDVASNLTEIQQPPSLNSSLVLDANNNLLAVWGSQCGSPIEISRYDGLKNQWVSVAQSSNAKQQNWFQENHVVWIDQSANVIYIYGGSCSNVVSNGFYTYDIASGIFSEVSPLPSIMPRKMASAKAITLDKYHTLIIGGHNENAWMSMQQFAIFSHGSWSFVPVSNYTDIDSRDDPLLLPLWEDGDTSVTEILVIGGTVAGRKASPEIALLNFTTEMGWEFTVPSQNSDFAVKYAGFSIFNTLVSVDTDSSNDNASNGDSSNLSVELYGKNNYDSWSQVQQVSVITSNNADVNTQSSSGKSTPTAVIAIVSVLLPIIALALVGIGIWWWLRKRRERRLFLLPNERSRMREAPASDLASRPDWAPGDLYRLPSSSTYASGRTQDSVKQDLRLAKQRRNLHVVNPDTDTGNSDLGVSEFDTSLTQCNESDIISFSSKESSMIRPFDTRSTTSSRSTSSSSSNSSNSSHAIEIRDPEN